MEEITKYFEEKEIFEASRFIMKSIENI